MEQEVLRHRNAVFNRIYFSSLTLYKACVPVPLRWLMEVNLLLMALITLFVWGYTHFTYIVNPEDCLLNIVDQQFPRDAILQVEVYSNSSEIRHERQKALQEMYNKLYNTNHIHEQLESGSTGWIRGYCETSFLINLTGTNFLCQLILTEIIKALDDTERDTTVNKNTDMGDSVTTDAVEDGAMRDGEGTTGVVKDADAGFEDAKSGEGDTNMDMKDNSISDTGPLQDFISDPLDPAGGLQGSASTSPRESFYDMLTKKGTDKNHVDLAVAAFYSKNYTLYELLEFYSLQILVWDYTLLEFSQEPGYLSLTASARSRLNISVVKIYLDPSKSICFGGPFGQFLTEYFLGYDMMVISSFKGLLPSNRASGYVKNILTGSQYYYKVQWMGKWRYGAGFLPALFFTLVASVLLRRIHYHVFKFLTHFHHLLNQGIPMPIQTGAQIPFLIVTYATIGLVIVMSEALSDDSVFSLLMVGTVWEVDQFYSIYCKQNTSKIYLPWFFFLYHFLPYAYYIRFNGQFWFIPFLFHWLLLQHAMLFFLHHCELPLLDAGERRVDPAPVNLHLQQPPGPPPDRPPERENIPQPQEESQSEHSAAEQVSGETSSVGAEEQTGSTLLRPGLHRRSSGSDSNLVIPGTSVDPTHERNPQSQQSQLLTDDELRKIRLQHFERERD